jgi:predicted amino acid-binding ACT domain protein
MFLDIPKEQILLNVQEQVKENLEKASKELGQKIEVERLEWLITGLRIHLKD